MNRSAMGWLVLVAGWVMACASSSEPSQDALRGMDPTKACAVVVRKMTACKTAFGDVVRTTLLQDGRDVEFADREAASLVATLESTSAETACAARTDDLDPVLDCWTADCKKFAECVGYRKKKSADKNPASQAGGTKAASPPPAAAPVPDVHIAIEVDGQPAAPIDRALLEKTPPDFVDSGERSWRLETLLGAAARRPGVVFAVTGSEGLTVELRRPVKDGDPVPVLRLKAGGKVVATMVVPNAANPGYRGQSGRLRRPEDALLTVAAVKSINVLVP